MTTRTPYGGGAIGSLSTDRSPHRRPDERIARFIAEALGDSRTVLDVGAVAEDLPFADGEFDAAMTLFGVHQWPDVRAGLREMRRVTRGPVVILTCDPDLVRDFWLYRYAPEVLDTEALRHPTVEELASALGGSGTVQTVPIPWTAPTGSTRPTTGARRRCSTRPPGRRARPGALSTTGSANTSTGPSARTWSPVPGTKNSATCAIGRPTRDRS